MGWLPAAMMGCEHRGARLRRVTITLVTFRFLYVLRHHRPARFEFRSTGPIRRGITM
jgi:hypothetical protein